MKQKRASLRLTVRDIIEATGGKVISEEGNGFTGVSIDSRTIKDGELFVTLKGDRFDGHDFVEDALRRGNGAIVNSEFRIQSSNFRNKTIIAVDDTLLAIHNMARHRRKAFSGHIIGIVGSNGKTTTKELLSSILSTKFNVSKTMGNLNNHIGMPLSIIRTDSDAEAMVLEMGANKPGDIKELCDIAQPDIGIVTNIGYEHLEGFGSLQSVRDSELEILPYLKKIIVNADDAFLMEGVKANFSGELVTFGIEIPDADLIVRDIVSSDDGTRFSICAGSRCIDIDSKLIARFNVYNSLAAAAAAHAVGTSLLDIKKGLELFSGVDMRFEVRRHKGALFLNDVYNANPSSMEEAINELSRLLKYSEQKGQRYKRVIVILGDMLELGDYAVDAHEGLGKRLSEQPVDIFIGVGPLMSYALNVFAGERIWTDSSEAAGQRIKGMLQEGDIVLIKGSRSMKMEKVLQSITEENN
ncbi:MAG: UDP-N-acetylmuramoyl-tripeptide--D-alanyl-D-alanine ligase [Thermodesulfovibrionales bacterium]|nr:UDP-N-acetylmuramoyl-tripeptide--D-alanyl-D-alanine ligase [Thermodesulfovibrionales bacterium]